MHDPPAMEQRRVVLRADNMARLLERAGHPVKPDDIVGAYSRALSDLQSIWAEARDFDTPEQVIRVLARLQDGPRPALGTDLLADLARAYASAALDYPPEIWPDTTRTLAEVSRRGYKIGLICNTGRTPGWVIRRLFGEWGILGYFQALAFSNETGIRKPDPAIFHVVLASLGVEPEAALHVGDDVISDIAGAKAVGMRAVLVRADSAPAPVPPDARLARLGELIPVLDAWAGGPKG